jgi:cytochrome c oxidase subunit 3
MRDHPVLDVSDLQTTVVDQRATGWWGNAGMLVIEGAMFAMCAAIYLYTRARFDQWPPPPIPPPGPVAGGVVLASLVAGCFAMRIADRAALRNEPKPMILALWASVLLGALACVARGFEFVDVNCRWTDSAYGSVVWLILFMHAIHLVAVTGENLYLGVVLTRHEVDRRHRLDMRISAVYWYFVAGWWVVLYALVQLGGRS